MDRKDFLSQVGVGAAAILIPACIGGLASCKKTSSTPQNVDFTLDVSSGSLTSDGGFLVSNGVVVARVNSSTFIAVSAACTHEGTTVNYVANSNKFHCPNHGAEYNSTGVVTQGPATQNLKKYNAVLTGTSLHIFS